jgi:hypothetical protein
MRPVKSGHSTCRNIWRTAPKIADLVEKVADMIVAEPLGLEQLVEVCLHEALDYVHIFHAVK